MGACVAAKVSWDIVSMAAVCLQTLSACLTFTALLVKEALNNEAVCFRRARVDGDDVFKEPVDPAVTAAALGMPRGRHVSFGMELTVGQGRPDSCFAI